MNKKMSVKKGRRSLPGILFLLAVLMTIMIPFAAFAEEFSCTVNLPVKVQIDGKNPPAADYKFKIEAENNAPLPEVTEVTVNANDAATVEFGPIKYSRPGNYRYRITQITENKSNFTYDNRTYAVTVQILRSEDNTLHAEIVASTGNADGSKASEIAFVNKYSRPSSGGSDSDDDGGEPAPRPPRMPDGNSGKNSPTPINAPSAVSPAENTKAQLTPPNPEFPEASSVADAQNSRKLSSGNPQTGDTTHRVLWTMLSVGSGVLLLALILWKRRTDEADEK